MTGMIICKLLSALTVILLKKKKIIIYLACSRSSLGHAGCLVGAYELFVAAFRN